MLFQSPFLITSDSYNEENHAVIASKLEAIILVFMKQFL